MHPNFRAAPFVALFALALAHPAHAQQSVRVTVRVLHLDAPVAGATVRADGRSAVTGARGIATIELPAGTHSVVFERLGFEPDTLRLDLAAARDTALTVQLRESAVAIAPVVVAASRSGTILQDQPVRVEAVPQEEIEENQTVAPGGLTTLLEELPGVQIQPAAPGLGGAGLSLRGLPARHSQVLIDGLPLLGAEPDAFALLQTPPLDLARVEVIKGVASALYGGSALGGVLNLVSRGPTGDATVLANAASPTAADLTAFAPLPLTPRWGATLTGGAHVQDAADVDGDGWADLPRVRRAEARPRLFWSDPRGGSVFATVGAVAETRAGGFVSGPSPRYRESVDTRRLDGGIAGHALLGAGMVLGGRGSLTHLHHRRAFGTETEGDDKTAGYAEATLGASAGVHTWLAGAAVTYDALRSPEAPGAAYTYVTPAVFVQDEVAATDAVRLSASARADFQDRYGTFVSPRISALVRPGGGVALRASAGTGFATPHPLTDEVEAVGLRRLAPLRGLSAERAAGESFDAEWSGGAWELSASLFGSEIRHPLVAREDSADASRLRLMNLAGPRRTAGVEALARYAHGALQAIASYTHLDATEPGPAGRRQAVERVPRDAGELALLVENERRGRVGVELSYTGRQRVEDDPYRAFGRPFVEVNVLAALAVAGESSVFLNVIDLAGVRQTRWDPLLLPAPAPTGRRTTDVWAPLAGRTINLGARIEL